MISEVKIDKELKQLGFGDYNVKLAPGEVPEKYKNFVTYDKVSINFRYESFQPFDLSELVKIDKLKELENKTGIALMLQIVHISEYLLENARATDIKGNYSNAYLYDLFYRFYGFSRTFIKTCFQVYRTFWIKYYHPLYIDFSFSQLVEMLPLCKADMQKVMPDWSVRRIRAYKKELADLQNLKFQKKEKPKPEADIIEDINEADIEPIGVKSSYVISILSESAAEVLAKCKYDKKSISYKIFEKGVQAVLSDFSENIKLDNTFLQ